MSDGLGSCWGAPARGAFLLFGRSKVFLFTEKVYNIMGIIIWVIYGSSKKNRFQGHTFFNDLGIYRIPTPKL